MDHNGEFGGAVVVFVIPEPALDGGANGGPVRIAQQMKRVAVVGIAREPNERDMGSSGGVVTWRSVGWHWHTSLHGDNVFGLQSLWPLLDLEFDGLSLV